MTKASAFLVPGHALLAEARPGGPLTARPRTGAAGGGGVVGALCPVRGASVAEVTVEMGRATFRAPEIPMHGPDREVVGVPLQGGDRAFRVTCVSVGNPHCGGFPD